MAMFVVCVALMIAAALAFVLVPLLRHRSHAADPSARRLRALDQALAAGVIDADEHARKREALLASAGDAAPVRPSRSAFIAVLLVALLMPASALLLYRLVGTPQALDPANVAAATAGEHGLDMQQAIDALAARLAQQPDDVEGWALLARAYQATGRAQESLDAYRHAHELAKDNPAVTVEYAQALAVVSPDHRIAGESRDLLEGVLKKDASNQRALWLLGISDYQASHYDAAIARWNTLLPLLEANSDVAASVKQQIAEAEAMRDGKEPPAPSKPAGQEGGQGIAASAAPTKDSVASGAAVDAPRLTVQVSLDPKLADKLDADATLFVFARAASGPPMPLAIQRLKASQLPLTVTLDESMGMLPNMKLSMFPQVVIGARVSKSGNAMPQSGDLQILSAPLDVHHREPIALTIDQVVP
jgi:cytochrome c-type biogenesis protein CcmH